MHKNAQTALLQQEKKYKNGWKNVENNYLNNKDDNVPAWT